MRQLDVEHLGVDRVICCYEVDGVLVDPGPESAVETLVAKLGEERPRALLLTHLHFDHAGASGALVRRWPDLPVYVLRGQPHILPRFGKHGGHERRGAALFRQPGRTTEQVMVPVARLLTEPDEVEKIPRGPGIDRVEVAASGGPGGFRPRRGPFGRLPVSG